MKVLWICNVILPKVAKSISMPISNGGGWLVGLSNELLCRDDIDLSVCFPVYNSREMIIGMVENLQYFGVPQKEKNPTIYNERLEKYFEYVIKQVRPDIIHVFGTEYPHTLALVRTCKGLGIINKVVINIQGLMSIGCEHYFSNLPLNVIKRNSLIDFLINGNIKKQRDAFEARGKYEIEAIKNVEHIIGRTEWDKACTFQINPKVEYHFCNETLRDEFYEHSWSIKKCKRHTILVSQATYPIKGLHFVLEAMPEIIRRYPDTHLYVAGTNYVNNISLRKRIVRSEYIKYIIKIINKLGLNDYVTFTGELDEKQMCERFLKTHVYLSPSSIENESNSLSEAKLLGIPCVASYVGGVTDRIVNGIDGFTYQHDASYMIAHYICRIFGDDILALKFSNYAKKHASIVNDKSKNLETLLYIYQSIRKKAEE